MDYPSISKRRFLTSRAETKFNGTTLKKKDYGHFTVLLLLKNKYVKHDATVNPVLLKLIRRTDFTAEKSAPCFA